MLAPLDPSKICTWSSKDGGRTLWVQKQNWVEASFGRLIGVFDREGQNPITSHQEQHNWRREEEDEKKEEEEVACDTLDLIG